MTLGLGMDVVFKPIPAKRSPGDELLTLTKRNVGLLASEAVVSSEDEVLQILEAQPALEDLTRCLEWLVQHRGPFGNFNITLPSPRAARIVNVLVTDVATSFWDLLRSDPHHRSQLEDFLVCLRSIPGLGALLMRIKALADEAERSRDGSNSTNPQAVDNIPVLQSTRDLLTHVLYGKDTVNQILDTIFAFEENGQQQQTLWNQGIALLGGGKVLSTLAQADLLVINKEAQEYKDSLGNGAVYATWLGENLKHIDVTNSNNPEQRSTAKAALFSRAISLGYTQQLIESSFESSFAGDEPQAELDHSFLKTLRIHEQRQVLYHTLQLASRPQYRDTRKAFVAGLACLLKKWCGGKVGEAHPLSQWIAGVDRGRTIADVTVHRAVVVVLAEDEKRLFDVCELLIKSFGDPLYIQKAPIAQQEAQVQDILLVLGRLFQCDAATAKQLSKSSVYINAISNRLASSASRPRLLGMFLAVAASELMDDGDARLSFEEVLSNEKEMGTFRGLLHFNDRIGRISDLQVLEKDENRLYGQLKADQRLLDASMAPLPRQQSQAQDPDSSGSEDEDDPTLVNRKKPIPPVYVRDLLRGLSNSDEQEQYRLCLMHAAKLIRRKTNFGTEVKDHLEEIAAALAGARDVFEKKQLGEAQLQGMIAVIVASPSKMGHWFSVSVFAGDYSVSQRTSILTALAFAARELAGYKNEDSSVLSSTQRSQTDLDSMFPSKRLPPSLRAFSGLPLTHSTPVDIATSKMEQALIRPMAASAADGITGPNVLKVRTFSSRLKPNRKPQSTISNELSKVVADSIFFPLTDRFRLEMDSRGSSSSFALPFLLAHFLKTLGLLIAASGSNTLSLSLLTNELLALCLSSKLRHSAVVHLPVLESLLFCLLVLLEVNSFAAKSFVSEHGSDLLEAKAWVEIALERVVPGDQETERVRALGAGVLVQCVELINQYQEQMLGRAAEFF